MNRIDYTKLHILGRFNPNTEYTDYFERIGVVTNVAGCDAWVEGENGDDQIAVEIVSRLNKNRRGYQRVMEITLSKYKDSYHVELARIDSKYQGHGIAPKVYKYLMRKLGIILKAGNQQSPGGRYIWAKMASMAGLDVFALDGRGNYYDVEVDDNELVTTYGKIYDDSRRRMHVFAVAG